MSRKRREYDLSKDPEHYFNRSQRPLQSLIFLLPFLIVYEAGVLLMPVNQQVGHIQHILARSLLADLLGLFGAAGGYLPGLAVVIVLLSWHVARRDKWELDWRLNMAMGAESVALAVPLLMFALVWRSEPAWATTLMSPHITEAGREIVYALGAGVYEELVFRLMGIAILHMILTDMIGLNAKTGAIIAIACSAGLFASYHFTVVNPFTWVKFTFYSAAGVYLAVIYVLRGFGIVAASHACYDIFYVIMTFQAASEH